MNQASDKSDKMGGSKDRILRDQNLIKNQEL
jgi:hypothetical protein